jgi:hypothetical protein
VKEKVCSKEAIRYLQNEYNNLQSLYEYLGQRSRLRVTLACLHEMKGFVGLFKVLPRGRDRQARVRELEKEL